uniref:Uncharacterized protein n=1 Tax=viral metagenome TaxID=1070528 RepID=A0A6M3IKM1_9ZZZZ
MSHERRTSQDEPEQLWFEDTIRESDDNIRPSAEDTLTRFFTAIPIADIDELKAASVNRARATDLYAKTKANAAAAKAALDDTTSLEQQIVDRIVAAQTTPLFDAASAADVTQDGDT